MTIELRPLHDDFGIEILNVDISAGLDDTEFAEIERAVEDYSVVLIKHQNLDDDLQLAFGNRLGELEFDHVTYGRDRRINYVYRIGNIDWDGNHMPASHERVVFSTG
ncbi:MAG: TauD/TfdA family dioxygenase, partial [Pseudomonadota bacterium]|nr:TauD/TfdA family dioxygenase [Pseudomonadota bacterium]